MAKLEPFFAVTKTGAKITIRSPEVGEGEALLSVVKEIISHSEHLLTEFDEFIYTAKQEDEMILSYQAHPDKLLLTPRVDGRMVGMMDFAAGYRRRSSHQGEFGISILPRFRGQGIGQLVLQSLIGWATGNPRLEWLRLRVHARNLGAAFLYRKNGFVEEGRERKGVKLADGSYDDVLLMARSVK